MFKQVVLFCVIVCCCWSSSLGQIPSRTFPFHYQMAGRGQDVNFVYQISQDQQGFLWWATFDGLVRYDGYECRQFSGSNGAAIHGRRIHGMAIDGDDQLWFVAGERLQVLDLIREEFRTISLPDTDSLLQFSFSKFNPLMIRAADGIIWLRSEKGLLRIQSTRPATQSSIKRYPGPDSDTINVQVLYLDKEQRLWVGSDAGLFRFQTEEDRLEACPLGLEVHVTALCQTKDGKIAIGSADGGLHLYDPLTSQVVHLSSENTGIAGQSIHQLASDGAGNLWLFAGSYLTQTFSLQRWDAAEGRFQTCLSNQTAAGGKAQLGEIGFQLFTDSQGLLWVVSSHGLYQFNPWQNQFFQIKEKENHPKDWSGVNPMFEDQTGVLWWGTSADGVFSYASSSNKFRVFQPLVNGERSLSFSAPLHIDRQGQLWLTAAGTTRCYRFAGNDQPLQVASYPFHSLSFLEDQGGNIWMSTYRGIFRYDGLTETVAQASLPIPAQVPYAIVLEDKEGWFWLPSLGQGLFRYHPEKDTLVHFQHDPENTSSLQSDALSAAIIQDRQGRIWVGGMNGLECFDPGTGKFSHFLRDVKSVVQLFEDQSSRIWATTAGGGMYRVAFGDTTVVHFSRQREFPSDRPFYLLHDTTGMFWISSDQGLIRLDPRTDTWLLFDEHDGLPRPNFAYGAVARTNGEFFFSLMNGDVVRFNPTQIQEDSILPQVYFTHLKIANESVVIGAKDSPLSQAMWATEQLELTHRQRVFSIDFSALHFAAPGHNKYAWRMLGLQDDWQYIEEERRLNFAGLSPGRYTLQIKAANHDGRWGPSQSLQLRVYPPWWASTGALITYGLLGGFLLWGVYLRRRKRWKLQTQLLIEHKESIRLKELDQLKTKLYTNISHEFRTPLTVILGMADQIRKHPEEWYVEGLEMIKRNGRQLLRLVNQMLQLSKVEAGVLPVKRVQADVLAYTRYLLDNFRVLAKDRNIRLEFQTAHKSCLLDFDPDKWCDIFTNLVSNALKFTPPGGQVSVIIHVLKTEPARRFVLIVKDTGIGIAPDQLPFVFDRFFSNGDQLSNTGIGLALTKELTLLLGGNISVQSELGKGSSFRVELPIQQATKRALMGELPMNQPVLPVREKGKPPTQSESHNEKRVRLLIVEDNQDVVQYLTVLLAKDYELLVATDGVAGLQEARDQVPDLIISDVMMPKLDGFDLCTQLKADTITSHIPIVLLTAKVDVGARIKGLRSGADAYLNKPFNEQELWVRLQMLFLAQQRQQERYRQINFSASDDPQEQQEDAFMMQIQSILEAHLSDEYYGVQNLCNELGMSRAQLYRKFKSLTDQTIGHYFRSLRLHKARELLRQTNLNVAEIAYRVGFKDPAYFSRVFRGEFGESPREWSRKDAH